jgi:hypothetical protein
MRNSGPNYVKELIFSVIIDTQARYKLMLKTPQCMHSHSQEADFRSLSQNTLIFFNHNSYCRLNINLQLIYNLCQINPIDIIMLIQLKSASISSSSERVGLPYERSYFPTDSFYAVPFSAQ